jgi:hypothetical protein
VATNVGVVQEQEPSSYVFVIIREELRHQVPVGTTQDKAGRLLVRFINYLTSSVVAALESTDDEGIGNTDFEVIDSIHFVANVNLTFHHEEDHVHAL